MGRGNFFRMNRTQQVSTAFVSAALLLVLVQAGILAEVFSSPDARIPVDVRTARQQLTEMEGLREAKAKLAQLDPESLPRRFDEEIAAVSASGGQTPGQGVVGISILEESVFTPGLTGILEERSVDGRVSFRACFAQGTFSAGDKVGEFRISKVYADRVILMRRGESYMVRLQGRAEFGEVVPARNGS